MYNQMFSLHADLLKALAQPKRLEIIHLLRDQELTVGQIQSMLDLSQANLSQHLMVLRQHGVVDTRRNGKHIYYRLSHPEVIEASDLLRQVLVKRHEHSPLGQELKLKIGQLVPLTHDPVCKMRLSPKTAAYTHDLQGETYYFCAKGCLKNFIKHPEKYLNG